MMMTRKVFQTICSVGLFLATMVGVSGQTKPPKILTNFLQANKVYEAEWVDVKPPKEIEKYIDLVKVTAQENPEWYKEYSKDAKPGIPLAYHENLNLTPEQYQEYLKLWGQRKFIVLDRAAVRLEYFRDGWRFAVSGKGGRITRLQYHEKEDVFHSTNGVMKRIEDVDAAAITILGAWKGVEWRMIEEDDLGTNKENFAIGRSADGKYCFIVYRNQHMSAYGTILEDLSRVIRISLK